MQLNGRRTFYIIVFPFIFVFKMASNGCWFEENMKEQIKLFNEGCGNFVVNETRIM